jgi:hypothetical protein
LGALPKAIPEIFPAELNIFSKAIKVADKEKIEKMICSFFLRKEKLFIPMKTNNKELKKMIK